MAPTVSISGNLNSGTGAGPFILSCSNIGVGTIRIEAFTIGAINANGNLYTGTPYNLFISSASTPAINVTSVGGVAVATNPTGTFTIPDVTVNSSAPLTFAIQASNIPIGTTATLTIFSEERAGPNDLPLRL